MTDDTKIHLFEDFEPLLGENFTISKTGVDDTLTAKLVEAELSKIPAPADALRQGFSLLFQLSLNPQIDQNLYQVSHPSLGTLDMLLVPVKATEEHYFMETIYN